MCEHHKTLDERCQKARNIKIELEQKFEFVETRAHESQKKLEALRTELEYNVLEEGRRQDGCKNAIDSAFKSEKTCLDVQKSYEVALKKKEVALKKVNSLEAKITKAENSMDSTNYDRRRIEATIKELLGNIKNQGM